MALAATDGDDAKIDAFASSEMIYEIYKMFEVSVRCALLAFDGMMTVISPNNFHLTNPAPEDGSHHKDRVREREKRTSRAGPPAA